MPAGAALLIPSSRSRREGAKQMAKGRRLNKTAPTLARVAAALFLLAALAPAQAQSSKPIELIVFPGGFNWPIWIGEEKGFFARNAVAVKVTPTPGSAFQLTNLIDGKFDIAMTAIDNLIAYSEGQGAAPTKETPDLVAFMGADNGFLRLMAV